MSLPFEEWRERHSLKGSLLGKTLRAVRHDGDSIWFDTDAGGVQWVVDADCCSTTWVEAVDFGLCLGHRVTDVEEVDLPESWYAAHPGPPEEDCLRTYGITIKTTGGAGTIDFRNESNGYYGGSMVVRTFARPTPSDERDGE